MSEKLKIMRLNFWKIGFVTTGLVPIGFIVSLLTFYYHASRILGRFPVYNQPDPKELDIYNKYSGIIYSCSNIWIISFLVLILMIFIYWIIKRKQTDWKLIGFSSIGHVIAVLLLFSGIMEWFVD